MLCLKQTRLLLYTNFMKEKKCRKLQKYLAISGLQPLAAGDLEGCADGVGKVTGGQRAWGRWPTGYACPRIVQSPRKSWKHRLQMTFLHTKPQCVVSGYT